MIHVTPTKVICEKCDMAVHTPTGLPYTGDPEHDKFIGMTAILHDSPQTIENHPECTLASDALILT
jgi:hypothetical protein